jgi:hypothetical protein
MKKYRLKVFKTISQIGVKYVNSDLTMNRVTEVLTIKAGERFPYFRTADDESLYDSLKTSRFCALYFVIENGSLKKDMKALEQEMPQLLRTIDLSNEKGLISALNIKKDCIILLRPDHYIGLITDEGAKVAGDYLRKLGTQKTDTEVKLPITHA